MSTATPRTIKEYFAAQSARDFDALVALFAADGIVVDEGKTWTGGAGIRRWRDEAASVYQYTTTVLDVSAEPGGEYLARVRLEGDFPGGIVDLDYRFTLDNGKIAKLHVD